MASLRQSTSQLLDELRRRKVAQVVLAYGAFAWLLLQFGSIVVESFDSPPWTMKVLFVALLAGLPVTVVLAWIFELTPGGIERTAPQSGEGHDLTGLPVVLVATVAGQSSEKGLSPNQANLLLREAALVAHEHQSETTLVHDQQLDVAFRDALHALAFGARLQAHAQKLDIALTVGITAADKGSNPDAMDSEQTSPAQWLSSVGVPGGMALDEATATALTAARKDWWRRWLVQRSVAPEAWPGSVFDLPPESIPDVNERLHATLGHALPAQPAIWLKGLALVFLTAVVGLLWSWLPGLGDGDEEVTPTLAVLPFTNIGGEPGSTPLFEGLSTDLFNAVAGMHGIRLAARRSSRLLHGSDMPVRELGVQLNAMLLLEGEIRQAGDRIELTAWLTDTRSGLERWSRIYQESPDLLPRLRQDLVADLGRELGLPVATSVDPAGDTAPSDFAEHYTDYLEAVGYLQLPRTEATLNAAQSRFQRIVRRAPGFQAARAGLCRTYLAWYVNYKDLARFETAQNYCQQALDENADNVDLMLALGDLHRIQGDTLRAREFYERGLALNASDVELQGGLAKALMAEGRKEEAEQALNRAIALDPAYAPQYADLGNLYLGQGRWDEAIAAFSKVTALLPDDFGAHANLGSAYFFAGRFDEAAAAYERSLALEPNRTALSNTATMHYYSGDFARAAELYRRATELAPEDFRLWANLADAQAQLPDEVEASELNYRKAYELLVANLIVNPNDPEVLALTAWCAVNIGLPEVAETRIDEARVLAENDPSIAYMAAQVYAGLGRQAEASSMVEAALLLGFPDAVLKATPSLPEP